MNISYKVFLRGCLISFFILNFFNYNTIAQLSPALLNILPDSCRPVPVDKKTLNIGEKINILVFARLNIPRDLYKEIDIIANQLAEDEIVNTDFDKKFEIITNLTTYYSRTNNYTKSKYFCKKTLDYIQSSKNLNYYLNSYQKTYSTLLSQEGNNEACINYSYEVLKIAEIKKDTIAMAYMYYCISRAYFNLLQFGSATTNLDRSIFLLNSEKLKNEDKKFYNSVLLHKCTLLIELYDATKNKVYGQKLQETLSLAKARKLTDPFFDNFKAAKAYYDKNYQKAVGICDSLIDFNEKNNLNGKIRNINYLKSFKGFALLQMGDERRAFPIINEQMALNNYQDKNGRRPNNAILNKFAKEMYLYFGRNKKWQEAYQYLNMYNTTGDSLKILENRGKAFNAELKYNYSKKTLEIKNLKIKNITQKTERNNAYFAATLAGLLLLLTFFAFYFVAKQNKLKDQLVKQETENTIDALKISSQLQIAELEERNKYIKKAEQK
jgi:hypothetical protein